MSVKEQYPVVPAAVSFHQNTLLTAEVAGIQYAAMNPIIEGMGLNRQTQQRKIISSPRYSHMTLPLQTTGGIQKMVCIPLSKLNGWLFSVNADKVKPELREKIVQYQEECFVVLHDYWHKGAAINDRVAGDYNGQPDPVRLAVQMMPIFLQMIQGATNRIEKQGETVEKVVKEQGEASATRDTIIQQKGEDLSEQMLEIRGEVDEVADATDSLLLHTSAIMTQNQETSLMIGELQGQIEAGMNRFKDIIQAPILKALADHRAHFDTLMGMQNAMFDHMSAQMTMIKHKAECAMNAEKRTGMLAYLHQNLPGSPLEPMVTSIHDNSNSVEKFMDTCLEKSEGGKLQYGLLHKVYKAWCYEHNALPLGRDTAWIKFQQVLIKRNMKGFCMKPYRALEDVRFKEGALQPL